MICKINQKQKRVSLSTLLPLFIILIYCTTMLLGCADTSDKKIKIGLSMDSLRVERWQKDRDIFKAEAEKLGAEVIVQSADGDPLKQNEQAENMITQGVDVLVVIPEDSVASSQIVESAHAEGIKVIAYDRLIRDSEPDLYISFDNEQVGYLQAEYLLRKKPKGNFFLLGGDPGDNNAQLLREGQLRALQPALDNGNIQLVADGKHWAVGWDPLDALNKAEQVLTLTNNQIDAVVASNDGTAGGVVQALEGQNLAGNVLVSGQDADLEACQRIVKGTQTMTVYKPIRLIATEAAHAAVALAKGETIQKADQTVNNGKIDVPSIILTPIQVDKDNLDEVVIKDGYHSQEDVYKSE
ncbi:D-xylose ABC transporter substrate-binding protein [Candidatus Poribacteria bacterium]|nr:MAG: D-xylose ABC transporter substrate-binding protein [Candidatus Poribacteria bacterium]